MTYGGEWKEEHVCRALESIRSNFSFFVRDPATIGSYTLSLHDALPIYRPSRGGASWSSTRATSTPRCSSATCASRDRKSTRLNSSHSQSSYAVFCLKKKNI